MRLFRWPRLRPPPGPPDLASRCLFIIGAPRTGTTVLQDALNDSPDIFLLGEPDLYGDEAPGFRARYNAMHRGWGNQPTKSTFLPAFARADGALADHLQAAAARHRWTGAKLVINSIRAQDDLERRLDLHIRDYYRASYLFTFRQPVAATVSTRELQRLTEGRTDGDRAILRNLVEVVGLYVRALRLLPRVRAVFHDGVDGETFAALGRWLQTPLEGSLTYYDPSRVRAYPDVRLEGVEPAVTEAVRQLFDDLRAGVAQGFGTPQLEQNDRHLDPGHYTPLGSIDRRARVLAEALR